MFSATASCKLSENGVRSREGRSGASGKPSDGGGSPSPVVEVSRRGLVRPTVVDDRAWDLGPQRELIRNDGSEMGAFTHMECNSASISEIVRRSSGFTCQHLVRLNQSSVVRPCAVASSVRTGRLPSIIMVITWAAVA